MQSTPRRDLSPILDNARRLLDDAILLQQHGRFPTATALAILAIEEAGKYYLLEWEQERRKRKGITYHMEKQAVLGCLYIGKDASDYLNDLMLALGLPQTVEAVGMLLQMLSLAQNHPEYGVAAKAFYKIIEDNIIKCVARRGGDMTYHALRGETERLKHSCLYVDSDEEGQVSSTHNKIGSKEAREWISHAQALISGEADKMGQKNPNAQQTIRSEE